ncbi:hypothetical protein A0H81_10444 [Grifola frondosa]|uniref:Uncharacterized protein n=1 Tax=Grifola frondosa TaxID=5627 RepID=A0A1C7LY87_GRIFR|nr:hypothetical protein A0H81_10444 [Grifola frondosa]
MDAAALRALSRSELQKLAKANGVRANSKTETIINELAALFPDGVPTVPLPENPPHPAERTLRRTRAAQRHSTYRRSNNPGPSSILRLRMVADDTLLRTPRSRRGSIENVNPAPAEPGPSRPAAVVAAVSGVVDFAALMKALPSISQAASPATIPKPLPSISQAASPTSIAKAAPSANRVFRAAATTKAIPNVSRATSPVAIVEAGPSVSAEATPTVNAHAGPSGNAVANPVADANAVAFIADAVASVRAMIEPAFKLRTGPTVDATANPGSGANASPAADARADPTTNAIANSVANAEADPSADFAVAFIEDAVARVRAKLDPAVSATAGPTVSEAGPMQWPERAMQSRASGALVIHMRVTSSHFLSPGADAALPNYVDEPVQEAPAPPSPSLMATEYSYESEEETIPQPAVLRDVEKAVEIINTLAEGYKALDEERAEILETAKCLMGEVQQLRTLASQEHAMHRALATNFLYWQPIAPRWTDEDLWGDQESWSEERMGEASDQDFDWDINEELEEPENLGQSSCPRTAKIPACRIGFQRYPNSESTIPRMPDYMIGKRVINPGPPIAHMHEHPWQPQADFASEGAGGSQSGPSRLSPTSPPQKRSRENAGLDEREDDSSRQSKRSRTTAAETRQRTSHVARAADESRSEAVESDIPPIIGEGELEEIQDTQSVVEMLSAVVDDEDDRETPMQQAFNARLANVMAGSVPTPRTPRRPLQQSRRPGGYIRRQFF